MQDRTIVIQKGDTISIVPLGPVTVSPADDATSAPRLQPVTVAEVMAHRKANCAHCRGLGYFMRRETPAQKDAVIVACGCAQRRFWRVNADNVERNDAGAVFWKPGKSAPATNA